MIDIRELLQDIPGRDIELRSIFRGVGHSDLDVVRSGLEVVRSELIGFVTRSGR